MQPIYVETSDEITTVIERLKSSSSRELALVVPKGAILLQSLVNLKLALRAAAEVHKEITLVTTDKIGRNLAAQLGITTVSSLEQAGETEEPASEEAPMIAGVKIHRYYDYPEPAASEEAVAAPIIPKIILKEPAPQPEPVEQAPIVVRPISQDPPPPELPQVPVVAVEQLPTDPLPKKTSPPRRRIPLLAYLFTLLLLVTSGVVLFTLPKTTLTIVVPGKSWSKQYAVVASNPLSTTSDTTMATALITLTDEVSDSSTVKATGTKDIGTKAQGTVSLINSRDSNPQVVPAGTIVSTSAGQSFQIPNTITVPGASLSNGQTVSGSISVSIIATSEGDTSNLSSGTGSLSNPPNPNVTAQDFSTSGGTTKIVTVLSQSDLDGAKANLTKKLTDASTAKVSDQLKGHNYLSKDGSDSFSLVSFTSDHAVGDQVDQATISAKGSDKRLVIDLDQLKSQFVSLAQASVGKSNNLSISAIQTTNLQLHSNPSTLSVTIIGTGKTSTPIDPSKYQSHLLGLSNQAALDYLKAQLPDSTFTLQPSPSWWPFKHLSYASHSLTLKVSYE